jgi:CheY-like chemotaxis protein
MKDRLTVLVVDDDPDVRDTIADVLGTEGYRVLEASEGKEALRVLELARPNLIILDMLMPVMNGRAFLEEQRRIPAVADIPVLVITAYGVAHEDADRLKTAGFLKKPMEIRELLQTVAHLTAGTPGAQKSPESVP